MLTIIDTLPDIDLKNNRVRVVSFACKQGATLSSLIQMWTYKVAAAVILTGAIACSQESSYALVTMHAHSMSIEYSHGPW